MPSPARTMPPLKRQADPAAVVEEHLDALNACDWERLMAQYPSDVEIFLPGGTVVIGRERVGELFEAVVKPLAQGGIGGLNFEKVHTLSAGDTLVVQWRITGDALAEPYDGSDAYITRDGLMAAQVSTFVPGDMKLRR
jgi:ketosteroid isomerase-like protein